MAGVKTLTVFIPVLLLTWHIAHGASVWGSSQKDDRAFEAVWNVPYGRCHNKWNVNIPVQEFGITENTDREWKGDRMVIFYESELGLYPYLTEDEVPHNGGIPQLADFDAHYEKATRDIETTIPDKDFSGYAVIDWESWRPVYDRNWGAMKRYKRWSQELEREKHPDWSEDTVKEEARIQFEKAARTLMEGTLLLARGLRPYGKWGFYGFPRCYNYDGEKECKKSTRSQNEQLGWLFDTSTAIYSSAYLSINATSTREYVHGHVQETLRMRDYINQPNKPTFMYLRLTRGDEIYYTQEDLENSYQISADSGLTGVIIWGSSANVGSKDSCQTLKDYMGKPFGPFIQNILEEAKSCSKLMCNGQGRCYEKDPYVPQSRGAVDEITHDRGQHWKRAMESKLCHCYEGWTGLSCDKTVTA